MLKGAILSVFGLCGAFVLKLFGGWDSIMLTLIIFIAIDYLTGLLVAGVFKASPKTTNGALESKAGLKGLCKKGMILFFVLIAAQLDMIVGVNFIRDGTIVAFCANELLSIVENAGLMGVPIPAPITNAIEVLKKKGDKTGD